MPRAPESRILLLSWHFPPDSAVGGLRWQKLAALAAERGWGVDVLMRDTRALRTTDAERVRELPEGTQLFSVPDRKSWAERVVDMVAFMARRASRRVAAVSAGLSPAVESLPRIAVRVPRTLRELSREWLSFASWSHGRVWARDARRVARSVVRRGAHRVVVSCGPPHFAHVAAARVAHDHDLPLVVDLRDPWSQAQRMPEFAASVTTLWLAGRDEARVVRRARLTVANTDAARDALQARYPRLASRIMAVPNGYDDDPLPAPCRSEKFTIAYAGTIYIDRDPRPLLRAVRQVSRAANAGPDEIGLEFLGDANSLDGVPVTRMAADEGVGAFVEVRPRTSRREALAFLNRAAMLVVLGQDSDMAIPAKAFEYMRFAAWILVLADPRSAMGRLMARAGADVVAPHDVDAIADVIGRRRREHAAGAQAVPLAINPEFSRRARADQLFGAIEAITGQPERPASTVPRVVSRFVDASTARVEASRPVAGFLSYAAASAAGSRNGNRIGRSPGAASNGG